MTTTITCFAIAVSVSACLPGAVILPVPIGHLAEPWIEGTLTRNHEPVSGALVQIARDIKGEVCTGSMQDTITNDHGAFSFDGDRTIWTIWHPPFKDFKVDICIIFEGQTHSWRRDIQHVESDTLEIVCDLARSEADFCTVTNKESTG